MDLPSIRRTIIKAMFSDDRLMNVLVLKGGNALNLVHRIGARASLDVAFSIEGDLEDLVEVHERASGLSKAGSSLKGTSSSTPASSAGPRRKQTHGGADIASRSS